MRKNTNKIHDMYGLTSLQEGILFHAIDVNEGEYFLQEVYDCKKEVNPVIVRSALYLLSDKYEVLKTRFLYRKVDKPVQVILRGMEPELNVIDLSDERKKNDRVDMIVKEDRKRGFDLERDTLLRVTLLVLDRESYKMIWSIHHIITDGWSNTLIDESFFYFYKQLLMGRDRGELEAEILHENRKTFGDYVRWRNRKDNKQAIEYWKDFLQGFHRVTDIERRDNNLYRENRKKEIEFSFSKEDTELLHNKCKEYSATLSALMEIALGILLKGYNNTNDVAFGKVVSGRNVEYSNIEEMVGLFINTIVQRIKIDNDVKVSDLLHKVMVQSLESMKYEDIGLKDIQHYANHDEKIFNILFVYENYPEVEIDKSGFQSETVYGMTNYDMQFTVFDKKELIVRISYNSSQYSDKQIEYVLKHYVSAIRWIIGNMEAKAGAVSYINEEERNVVLNSFNNTFVEYTESTINEIFDKQVGKYYNQPALVFQKRILTYGEVNKLVNQVAYQLRRWGVKRNELVVLIGERNIEMLVGILGIIKSGAAYVPVDPEYPRDRIDYIFTDSNAKVIVSCIQDFKKVEYVDAISWIEEQKGNSQIDTLDLMKDKFVWLNPSDNLKNVNLAGDNIYAIYTSGTTGKPKGVLNQHKGIVNLMNWMQNKYPLSEQDSILFKTTFVFDVSVSEIMWWFFAGGKLIIASSGAEKEPLVLCEIIEEHKVTVIDFVPSMLKMFLMVLQEHKNSFYKIFSLRYVISAGEALNRDTVGQFYELFKDRSTKLLNLYGPTETSVYATYYQCNQAEKGGVPIGRPIGNTQIYIMQEDDFCGVGIVGELCIAGVGVARGYINQPELTNERFINNPFGEGKLYRTGDFARWNERGEIEYLGRIDEQIKIRGFRIELSEIESALKKNPHIKDCTVAISLEKNNEKVIVAYVISDVKLDMLEIRNKLSKELPKYMMPSYFIQIEEFPLSLNGKLDKKKLPKAVFKENRKYVAPRNKTDQILCEIVAKIMEVEKVGIYDDFYELGGNSLLAIRFIVELTRHNLDIKVKDIYKYKTICNISDFIDNREIRINTNTCRECKCENGGIEPFNEIFFKSCYYNALFSAIHSHEEIVLQVLVNNVSVYGYGENNMFTMLYYEIESEESVLNRNGVRVTKKDNCKDICSDLRVSLKKGSVVTVSIDAYYSSIRKDVYQKVHCRHILLIYGMDELREQFYVIEHTNRDNLTYLKQEMSYSDLEQAYVGYISNYGTEDAVYYEITREEDGSVLKESHNRLKEQCIQAIQIEKQSLQKGLGLLDVFSVQFGIAIHDESQLKVKIREYVEEFSDIINAKKVEQYKYEKIFGRESYYCKKANEISELWQKARVVLCRYYYSGNYFESELNEILLILQRIKEKELEFYEKIQ